MTAKLSRSPELARRAAGPAPRLDGVRAEHAQHPGPVVLPVHRVLVLGYLWLRRDATPGSAPAWTSPSVALPSILGGLIAFGVVIGPAYAPRDGEGGRHPAAAPRPCPHGLVGYFSRPAAAAQRSSLVPQLVVILVPSFLLFDGLMADPCGWFTVVWVILLGLLAALPIGMIIGALVPGVQKVGMWGMLPVMVLAGISGIFYPVQAALGLGAGRRPGLPDVLDRPRHALGLPSGRRGRAGDRRAPGGPSRPSPCSAPGRSSGRSC